MTEKIGQFRMSLSVIVGAGGDLIVIEPSRRRRRCTLGQINSICTSREELGSSQIGGHGVRSEGAEEIAGITRVLSTS